MYDRPAAQSVLATIPGSGLSIRRSVTQITFRSWRKYSKLTGAFMATLDIKAPVNLLIEKRYHYKVQLTTRVLCHVHCIYTMGVKMWQDILLQG